MDFLLAIQRFDVGKTNSRRRAPARQRVPHTDGGTGMLAWCGTGARRGYAWSWSGGRVRGRKPTVLASLGAARSLEPGPAL